jgi:hypothetical protein
MAVRLPCVDAGRKHQVGSTRSEALGRKHKVGCRNQQAAAQAKSALL